MAINLNQLRQRVTEVRATRANEASAQATERANHASANAPQVANDFVKHIEDVMDAQAEMGETTFTATANLTEEQWTTEFINEVLLRIRDRVPDEVQYAPKKRVIEVAEQTVRQIIIDGDFGE